eukprot:10895171-Prorocentrum_lima.AAC.1
MPSPPNTWICQHCQWYNDDKFDTCWQCREYRPNPRFEHWTSRSHEGAPPAPASSQEPAGSWKWETVQQPQDGAPPAPAASPPAPAGGWKWESGNDS